MSEPSGLRVCFVGSGAGSHGLTRAEAMSAQGHHVRFVTIGAVQPSTVETVAARMPRGPLSAVLSFRAFFKAVRDFRPDLLHLHYAGGRLGTLAHLTGIHPLVSTVIGGDVLAEQHEGGWKPAERHATDIILRDSDLILAKSEMLRGKVLDFGPYETKTAVVRWGIDTDRFRRNENARAELRRRFGVDEKALLVLSPRSLQPLYNIDLVVAAFGIFARGHPNAFLAITETGAQPEYASRIRNQVAALGLSNRVGFWGAFSRTEMPDLYSAVDVAISMPRSDGLPQSLFEAMGCETPTVLGDLPAYREVAQNGQGVLFSAFDPASLAVVLSSASAESFRSMGRAGRARILEIADLRSEAHRVSEMYLGLMTLPKRRRRFDLIEALSLGPRSL